MVGFMKIIKFLIIDYELKKVYLLFKSMIEDG